MCYLCFTLTNCIDQCILQAKENEAMTRTQLLNQKLYQIQTWHGGFGLVLT